MVPSPLRSMSRNISSSSVPSSGSPSRAGAACRSSATVIRPSLSLSNCQSGESKHGFYARLFVYLALPTLGFFFYLFYLKQSLTMSSCTGWPQTRRFSCLCLPSFGIRSVDHYAQPSSALVGGFVLLRQCLVQARLSSNSA